MDGSAGRRLLVAGASAGIGRAVAIAAWERGWRVAVVARSEGALAEMVADRAPDVALAIPADLTAEDAGKQACGRVLDAWGGIDAVLYCAGITHLAALRDTSAADWSRLLDTNVVGAALLAGAALGPLAESGGRLGLVSSDSVGSPMAGLVAYTVSKGALDHLAAVLPVEAPGVAVSRIVVGPTLTGMASGWAPDLAAAYFERWVAEGWFAGVVPQEPEVVAAEILARWLLPDAPAPVVDLAHLARP